MLECVGEIEYEYIVWISGIQDTVKWWDFVNMVINSEVHTAVLLKTEGFAVGLARQQHFASHRLDFFVYISYELLTLRLLMSYIYIYIYIYDISSLRVNDLTRILLTWRKW